MNDQIPAPQPPVDENSLIADEVLHGWAAGQQELYVLSPSRRYQPHRATLFIDFAVEQFRQFAGFGACPTPLEAG